MVLRLRTGPLGVRLERDAEFPERHSFSSDKFTELALLGVATLEGNVVTLRFTNAAAEYEILARPGEDPNEPSAWVLQLKEVIE